MKALIRNLKFSLLKLFKEEGVLAMDALAQQLTTPTEKTIVMVKQWDNATPHMCKTLKKWMKKEFFTRGWELRNQPPNSPITNTTDSAMFPSMAKILTAYQATHNWSHYRQGEVLWRGIQHVYNNYPLSTLSRAYMHHAKLANAIIDCEGGDEFVMASRSGCLCSIIYNLGVNKNHTSCTAVKQVELNTTMTNTIKKHDYRSN